MKTVTQLLRTKGQGILSVSPETPVFNALQVMAEKNVGALLVGGDEEDVHGFIPRASPYTVPGR